jgi:hypothetical protein
MPASLPHISNFLGRNIFNVAIATPQILPGRKFEIWGQICGQYMDIILESRLRLT